MEPMLFKRVLREFNCICGAMKKTKNLIGIYRLLPAALRKYIIVKLGMKSVLRISSEIEHATHSTFNHRRS
jgi:hypothetical protein